MKILAFHGFKATQEYHVDESDLLTGGEVFIGRNLDCHIVIDDIDSRVNIVVLSRDTKSIRNAIVCKINYRSFH